jgi:hypothetical protein
MQLDLQSPAWRGVFARVINDLAKLPRNARKLHVEACVWRSVAGYAPAAGAEEIAQMTWLMLRRLAEDRQSAA